ncbi:CapA family protein [Carboxylicivirga linearis]|uniref:CapA family protein n=1 Tax=Carboxylicivirga linearis TaxID=1628157 RepID=A0ABS5JSR9_9BACT|nr:CapA family protein [Carboxylicivirga linearis]MBS2097924.1 CapA family protein [Carboxylicivirga linearis]
MKKVVLLFALIIAYITPFSAQTQDTPSGLSFIGVGDMMLGTHFPSPQYLPPNNDPWPLLKEVQPVFAEADIVFGNLEGAFLDEGAVFKRCKDTTKCYAFKTPTSYAPALKKVGFNLLNIANNHIRDFGPDGLRSTTHILDSLEIPYAGLITKPTDILEYDGLKIGLCGFAPNSGTVQIGDIDNAIRIVKELKEKCDYVVVSFHGGAEGKKHQHVTRETEIFYGENRGNVYEFAHAMVDAGADIIFGHGPHVPRSIEIYNNRFIAYSLGNFCTYSRFNLSGANGLTPVIQIWTNPDGTFVKGKIHSFHQIKGAGTFPDPSNQVLYKMKDLTHIDFPELNDRLIIDDSGNFFMPFENPLKSKGIYSSNSRITTPNYLTPIEAPIVQKQEKKRRKRK